MAFDGLGDVEVDDAGLDDGALVFEIDLQNLVHASEGDDHAALARDGAAGESGTGATADEGNLQFVGDAGNGGDLLGGFGEEDEVWRVFVDAAVVFVELEIFGAVEAAERTDDVFEPVFRAGRQHRFSLGQVGGG